MKTKKIEKIKEAFNKGYDSVNKYNKKIFKIIDKEIIKDARPEAKVIMLLTTDKLKQDFIRYHEEDKGNICCLVLDQAKDTLVDQGRMKQKKNDYFGYSHFDYLSNAKINENKYMDKQKKKAIKLLEENELGYCSTPTQKTNGTLFFQDLRDLDELYYSISDNGNCRRYLPGDNKGSKIKFPYVTRSKFTKHSKHEEHVLVMRYKKIAKELLKNIEGYRRKKLVYYGTLR